MTVTLIESLKSTVRVPMSINNNVFINNKRGKTTYGLTFINVRVIKYRKVKMRLRQRSDI